MNERCVCCENTGFASGAGSRESESFMRYCPLNLLLSLMSLAVCNYTIFVDFFLIVKLKVVSILTHDFRRG